MFVPLCAVRHAFRLGALALDDLREAVLKRRSLPETSPDMHGALLSVEKGRERKQGVLITDMSHDPRGDDRQRTAAIRGS